MIKCSRKIDNNATMYFIYENKSYPICCIRCIKPLLTKILKNKTVKYYDLEELKELEKVEDKVVEKKLKQALMDLPKPKLKENKKHKNKKSVKKK